MNSIDNINNFDEELPEGFEGLPLEEPERLGEIYGDYYTEDNQKRELRIDWNPYEEFAPNFLQKQYPLVLRHILHHIQDLKVIALDP